MLKKSLFIAAAAILCAGAAFAQDTAPPASDDGTIVVPGQVERPVPTPPGDARTPAQRREDIRAWDRCVSRAQGAADTNPTRYQAQSPEEYCRDNLRMQDRLAVPVPLED